MKCFIFSFDAAKYYGKYAGTSWKNDNSLIHVISWQFSCEFIIREDENLFKECLFVESGLI